MWKNVVLQLEHCRRTFVKNLVLIRVVDCYVNIVYLNFKRKQTPNFNVEVYLQILMLPYLNFI